MSLPYPANCRNDAAHGCAVVLSRSCVFNIFALCKKLTFMPASTDRFEFVPRRSFLSRGTSAICIRGVCCCCFFWGGKGSFKQCEQQCYGATNRSVFPPVFNILAGILHVLRILTSLLKYALCFPYFYHFVVFTSEQAQGAAAAHGRAAQEEQDQQSAHCPSC